MMPAKTPINELIQRMIEAIRVGSVISYDGPRDRATHYIGGEASAEVSRLLSEALASPLRDVFREGWVWRNNADEVWQLSEIEPEICFEKARVLIPHSTPPTETLEAARP